MRTRKEEKKFSLTHANNIRACVAGEIVSKSVNMARPIAEELSIGISPGGRITVKTKPAGTTFTMSLPVKC